MQTLHRLRLDPRFMDNVAAWERLPARPARYAPWPAGLDPRLITALQTQGIDQLYTHQAQAVAAALAGQNVVAVTGTASGKTLGYNLPVLTTLLAEAEARALYLFPTKALAQDQADELAGLIAALERTMGDGRPAAGAASLVQRLSSSVHIYDGDTPSAQRPAIRQASGVLISNPDMLHTGLLPHHPKWAAWLGGLRYVVLDELHVYRGLFGSHLANVLRRLKRLCAFYGGRPQFLCASATIANPRELAEKLLEAPVAVIDDDGAPRAEKHFLVYNPPVLDTVTGVRRSYLLEAQRITDEFLRDDVQTALFARSRNATEILLGYVRDAAQARARQAGGNAAQAAEAIRGYRGGYLPLERRAIERGLRAGEVRGVVATNALELGVDIGQLGAVVMAGYPGTIASAWQQAGRAGRRAETSAVVLVCSAAPLDQFLAAHPRYLFERSPEHARINPDNLGLLADHLRCAVFELPFAPGESFGAFGDVPALLDALAEEGDVHVQAGTYRWVGSVYPAEAVSLRAATSDRIVIQDLSAGRPRVVGEVDRATAPVRVHTGAVYLHEGRAYLITKLDWENGLAEAQPQEVDYFTEAGEAVSVKVVEVMDAEERGNGGEDRAAEEPGSAGPSHAWGELLITAQAVSFRQVRRYTHETLGYGAIDLPAREFQTTGYWLWFPAEAAAQLAREGLWLGPNNYGPNWEQQRRAARARDGFRCRQCGRPEVPGERQHDVHHNVPFRSFGYVPGVNENYRPANALENLVTLCHSCHERVEAARGTQTALGGLAHALGNVAPLFLMCDPRDLGLLAEPRSAETGAPTITLYDQAPEGLGLAEQLYALRRPLLRGAAEL
ncbi:MAG: DEAD/DEAH box helicase, partial [Anaerolineales bacterium]|nr:DEAD/DEAH box helicase [Anaerolineales bacterium]